MSGSSKSEEGDDKVDGTASGDTMNVGFTDVQGDEITDGSDLIYGYGGDDEVVGIFPTSPARAASPASQGKC
mgnify:CR=1 FL=1